MDRWNAQAQPKIRTLTAPGGDGPADAKDLAEAEVNAIRNQDLVERRRNQILDAALNLFLRKGYASTTIRDICAASGVNQASLYDYIANRQDILRRLMNRVWFQPARQSHLARLEDPEHDGEDLATLLRAHFRRQWTENRGGIQLAYRSAPHLDAEDRALLRAREERQISILAAYIRRRRGLTEEDQRPEVIANLITFVNAYGPMRDWVDQDVPDDLRLDTVVAGVIAMVDGLEP